MTQRVTRRMSFRWPGRGMGLGVRETGHMSLNTVSVENPKRGGLLIDLQVISVLLKLSFLNKQLL